MTAGTARVLSQILVSYRFELVAQRAMLFLCVGRLWLNYNSAFLRFPSSGNGCQAGSEPLLAIQGRRLDRCPHLPPLGIGNSL
jgi:hypothetical protein